MKASVPLEVVVRRLGALCDHVVFVGGMIRSFLITDTAAGAARATDDVDVIVDVENHAAYQKMSEDLRRIGFREDDSEGAPICRWIVENVRVDVMPVDPAILGFSNVWYPGALESPAVFEVDSGRLRVIDGPHL